MAWNRKAIAELVANKTVDVVFEEVANAGDREIGPADASKVANAGIDAILASITASEKLAEQAKREHYALPDFLYLFHHPIPSRLSSCGLPTID